MKLGKHAVKVLAVFAVLFVVGFALKFLNLHEGFEADFSNEVELYGKRRWKYLRNAAKAHDISGDKAKQIFKKWDWSPTNNNTEKSD